MTERIYAVAEISTYKLFEVLQKEYLVCELRAKIYPLPKHKSYWENLANKKKEKINDIGKKYILQSLFDDKQIRKQYEKQIYNEQGLPNFYYPNETIKENQIKWDIINYFSIGSKVSFYTTEMNRVIGIIKKNTQKLESGEITPLELFVIEVENQEYELAIADMKRIFEV